jgi:hypothetical protein
MGERERNLPKTAHLKEAIRIDNKIYPKGIAISIQKKMLNLDREMWLCVIPNGGTTWLFTHELDFEDTTSEGSQ